jgi:hypothetical protein
MSYAVLLLLAAILMLEGCAHMPESIRPAAERIVTVEKPIPAPCLDKSQIPPPAVLMNDRNLLSLDEYHATIKSWQERQALREETMQLRAVLTACVK